MNDTLIFLGTEASLVISSTALATNLIAWAIVTDTTVGFAILAVAIVGVVVGILMLWVKPPKKAPKSAIERYLMEEEEAPSSRSTALISLVVAVRIVMIAIGVVIGLRGIAI